MSSHISKMLAAARREVELPESGWRFVILRAQTYQFMKAGIPLGTLIKNLSKTLASIRQGEEISDEDACRLNADAPSEQELVEALFRTCVHQMKGSEREWVELHGDQELRDRHEALLSSDPETPDEEITVARKAWYESAPEEPWERVRIVPDDAEADHDNDEITYSDFVRALDPHDLTVLQDAVWNLNGLGKAVAAALGPFCSMARRAPGPDGEGVRVPSDGPAGDGPSGVPARHSDLRAGDDGDGGGSEAGEAAH